MRWRWAFSSGASLEFATDWAVYRKSDRARVSVGANATDALCDNAVR